ncbi:MAG: AbrB/MazE/SpoVT family DNA-binding domain-containing protein [Thermomicrobiales bacterium]|nr:AbrB/MazE/SpoVT family DNA-binding domain-containing protein [Thermomicrobiales bacterium]
MVANTTVKVDAKRRLTLPLSLRKALGIEAGDIFFLDAEDGVPRFAKAENPFDLLAEDAIAQHRAGQTKSLEAFARENGFTLDDE